MDKRAIGERVARRRFELGLSKKDVARKAGRHPATIGRIEDGEHMPAAATLRAVADALDVPVSYLLGPEKEAA